MAVFNPPVPDTQDPNWLGWSKPITQPQADTSTGEALTTAGSAIASGSKELDELMKGYVKDQAFDETRKIMSDYTSNLEKADISTRIAATAAEGIGVPSSGATEFSSANKRTPLPATANAPLPTDLKTLPGTLDTLDSARGNNKLSNTAYLGRLDALAKDLRARYPGYRDYIDAEIHKVSGVNPANAYIQSLLGDINSFLNNTDTKAVDTKIRNELWTHNGAPGVAGPNGITARYQRGEYGPHGSRQAETIVMNALAPSMQLKYQLETQGKLREERAGQRQDILVDTDNMATTAMRGEVTQAFTSMQVRAGGFTAANIQQLLTDLDAGKVKLTDEQMVPIAREIDTIKLQTGQNIDKWLDSKAPDGRTNRQILTPEKANTLKAEHLKEFDTIKGLIMNNDTGYAMRAQQTNTRRTQQNILDLTNYGELGKSVQMLEAVSKSGLDDVTKGVFRDLISKGLPGKYDEYVKHSMGTLFTQPQLANGVVATAKEQVDRLEQRIQQAKENGVAFDPKEVAKTYDALLDYINRIPEVKNPVTRSNLIKATYNPANLGLLTKLEEDRWENGRFVPGKYKVFNGMFNDEQSRVVKASSPADWEAYKDMGKQMWGRELFGPFLRKFTNGLGNFQDSNFLKIGWDSDNHKFSYQITGPLDPAAQNYLRQNFDRLNNSFASVASIAKADGQDPNAFILSWLKAADVDTGRLPGVPQKMLDAVVNSKKEEEGTKLKFNERFGAPKVEPTKPRAAVNPEDMINPMTGLPFPKRTK